MDCSDCICNNCKHNRCSKFRCCECDLKINPHKDCINANIKELDKLNVIEDSI